MWATIILHIIYIQDYNERTVYYLICINMSGPIIQRLASIFRTAGIYPGSKPFHFAKWLLLSQPMPPRIIQSQGSEKKLQESFELNIIFFFAKLSFDIRVRVYVVLSAKSMKT